jgi:hypothetical protein
VFTNRAVRDEARKKDGIVINRPIHRGLLEEPDSNERFEVRSLRLGSVFVLRSSAVLAHGAAFCLAPPIALCHTYCAACKDHPVLAVHRMHCGASAVRLQQFMKHTAVLQPITHCCFATALRLQMWFGV